MTQLANVTARLLEVLLTVIWLVRETTSLPFTFRLQADLFHLGNRWWVKQDWIKMDENTILCIIFINIHSKYTYLKYVTDSDTEKTLVALTLATDSYSVLLEERNLGPKWVEIHPKCVRSINTNSVCCFFFGSLSINLFFLNVFSL